VTRLSINRGVVTAPRPQVRFPRRTEARYAWAARGGAARAHRRSIDRGFAARHRLRV